MRKRLPAYLIFQRIGKKPIALISNIAQKSGLVAGRHLAIDSTHVKAWSSRKSTDKEHPDFQLGKNCDFARLGMTPKGFMTCYRVHVATVTKSEIPIAIKVFPGNMNDKKAFKSIFRRALEHVAKPLLAVSADKDYSSGKNRKLIQAAGGASIIRPAKTDLMGNPLNHFIPGGMSEKTYWKVYWRRNAVERTFGQTKGHCGLKRPRVVDEEPVKQHVFLSFILHQLLTLASANLGLPKTCFSLFF